MKKALMLAAGLSCCGGVNADVLGVYAGAQVWDMGVDGGFANTDAVSEFNFDDQTQGSFYVAVEHPLPLVPNLKVIRSTLDTDGNTLLTSDFTFDDQTFTSTTNVFTDVEMTHTDVVLYYEFVDTDVLSLDFGINGKYIDGNILVQDSAASVTAEQSFSGVVPMLYGRMEFGLPFSGLGAYVEGSLLSFDDNTLYDYQAALTYTLVDNIAIDMDLQLGYRAVEVELDGLDDIYTSIDFDGVFAGVEFHF